MAEQSFCIQLNEGYSKLPHLRNDLSQITACSVAAQNGGKVVVTYKTAGDSLRAKAREYGQIAEKASEVVERVVLVACVKQKADHPAVPGELYQSSWFQKAWAYSQREFSHRFVLSAQYGLVKEADVIDPYEKTLNTMSKQHRISWAEDVAGRLAAWLSLVDQAEVTILAGKAYTEFLVPELVTRGVNVHLPLDGVGGIGKQLKWFNERTRQEC